MWAAKSTSEEEREQQEVYHLLPQTTAGKLSLALVFAGLAMFLTGIILGGVTSLAAGSLLAVGGMIVYFTGGLWRAYAD